MRLRGSYSYIAKQADFDKILKIIHIKLLKGIHLPITMNEIQVEYLNSPYFRDIYLYLVDNKLQSHNTAINRIATLEECYSLLDSLLFS